MVHLVGRPIYQAAHSEPAPLISKADTCIVIGLFIIGLSCL